MIDQTEFAKAWASLCKRFTRAVDRDEMREWHGYLSHRMETEAFLVAARKLWAASTFFPKPDDFLAVVAQDAQAAALADWELCQHVMAGSRTALGKMTEAGQHTVRLMGGEDRLRATAMDEVHFRRIEFLKLHGDSARIVEREGKALPGWTEEGRLKLREAIGPGLKVLGGGK